MRELIPTSKNDYTLIPEGEYLVEVEEKTTKNGYSILALRIKEGDFAGRYVFDNRAILHEMVGKTCNIKIAIREHPDGNSSELESKAITRNDCQICGNPRTTNKFQCPICKAKICQECQDGGLCAYCAEDEFNHYSPEEESAEDIDSLFKRLTEESEEKQKRKRKQKERSTEITEPARKIELPDVEID